MANKLLVITIFLRKFLKYYIEILISWKFLNFDKNRDKRKVFQQFFLSLNRKCALVIFQYFFMLIPSSDVLGLTETQLYVLFVPLKY